MENNPIRELQLAELETLKETIKYFDENGIVYYAIGGTLLGAVRHSGFIPWDDDIDLGVPRESYDRLIELERSGKCPLNIKGPWNSSCYWYPARVESEHLKVRRFVHDEEVEQNVWLDIFPLDGLPEGKLKHRLYWYRLDYRRLRFNLSRLGKYEASENGLKNIIKKILMIFIRPDKLDKEKEYTKFDRAMKRYGFKGMQYFLNAEGRCKMREIAPIKWLGSDFYLQFEDIKLRCLENYDEYLTQIYGNYMEPPKNASVYEHNVREIIRI